MPPVLSLKKTITYSQTFSFFLPHKDPENNFRNFVLVVPGSGGARTSGMVANTISGDVYFGGKKSVYYSSSLAMHGSRLIFGTEISLCFVLTM